jgi:hypothetical protein
LDRTKLKIPFCCESQRMLWRSMCQVSSSRRGGRERPASSAPEASGPPNPLQAPRRVATGLR